MVDREDRFRGVALWCPLDGTRDVRSRDKGVLWVVPGSHRLPTAGWYRSRWHARPSFDHLQDAIRSRYSVPLALEPGHAVVWDQKLVHHSGPNQSDEPRHVLALCLRPSEARNVNIECDAQGWVTFYDVDDEYYLLDPPEGEVPFPVLRRLPLAPPPRVTVDDLEAARIGSSTSE
jgi:hypothetical protein